MKSWDIFVSKSCLVSSDDKINECYYFVIKTINVR